MSLTRSMGDLILRRAINTIAPVLDGSVRSIFPTERYAFLGFYGCFLMEIRCSFWKSPSFRLTTRSFVKYR